MIRPLFFLLTMTMAVAGPAPKALSPAAVVEKQIEAFNAHDLEGFLAFFAEELEVSELPGNTAPEGKARLRELYAERFKVNPDLHASAEAQMVFGGFVIQKERIKGRAGKGALETVAIYQVKGGKILRMWGLRE